MTKLQDLTFWQNSSKRKFLQEYRELVVSYFKNIKYNEYSRDIIDSEKSQEIRRKLNKHSHSIEELFGLVGINTVLVYTPPRAIGGYVQNIDVISNIFNLHNFDIEPKSILDFVDQADGILEDDFKNSLIRTFNPIYWFSKIIEFIAEVPFKILGNIGVNQKKVEHSFAGKLIKEVIRLTSWVLALWQLAEKLSLVPTTINISNIIGK